MGASQSTPSRPSSPSLADPAIRPRSSRRLSSFGRSSRPTNRRKTTHPAPASASSREAAEPAQSASEIDDLSQIENRLLVDQPRLEGSLPVPVTKPTPSLPTTPGPPVPFIQDTQSPTPSYFPPPLPLAATAFPQSTTSSDEALYPPPRASTAPPEIIPSTADRSAPIVRPPLHNRYLSLPNLNPSPNDRTLSGTLTALLGFSGPPDPENSPPTGGESEADPDATRDPISAADALSQAIEEADRVLRAGAAQAESRLLRPEEGAEADSSSTISSAERATERARQRAELSELEARLDQARVELQRSRAELNNLRERRRERLEARSRIPVGAMLVIQGLAQTRITSSAIGEGRPAAEAQTAEGESDGSMPMSGDGVAGPSRTPSSASVPRRRPNLGRRVSDGSLFRRTRDAERERGASLEQQARMISGLLTVAAAATANTLLATPLTQPAAAPAPRTGISGAIQSLLNRLRPSRTPQHGIEQALGNYLRNAVRNRRRTTAASGSSSEGTSAESGDSSRLSLPPLDLSESQGGAEAGSEFQNFLRGLEEDLIGAVRAYAGSVRSEEGDEGPEPSTDDPGSETADEEAGAAARRPAAPVDDTPADVNVGAPESATATSVPAFHAQLGQNVPGAANSVQDRYGVSGGHNGQPRALNFFRAHLFPPMTFGPSSPASESPPTAANPRSASTGGDAEAGPSSVPAASASNSAPAAPADPNALVPCIFVGVRSIQHDPSSTTEDIFNQPGLFSGPSAPGSGAEASAASAASTAPGSPVAETPSVASADSTRPSLARLSTPPVTPSPPRSFRDRFLHRISRRPALTPHHPINTYLVYVIGGNYPANHPVLRIPALLSGAPLSDEDMALISELMGPAKAPTASKEDIERAGLRIVDGMDMAELGANGQVLDNCTERCLICLGEYEEGEECRILQCRHGYHKPCVDQWLEKGSNSCPACRSEAVNVKRGDTTDASTSVTDDTLPPLSTPIPVLSVPAGGQDTGYMDPDRLEEEVD